jgi:hypothetical protein
VAFFIQTIDKKDAKSLLEKRSDQNVKIITSKKINEPGYLDQKPQTYTYIVKGILYNNKWYYEKTEATYFDADNQIDGKVEYLNNLQGWDFFEENTAKPGVGFWEGKLFEKITDKRKDPNWGKYKDMWESDERDNRDYIGLYEIVADQLKIEDAATDSAFRTHLISDLLLPFFNQQIKSKQNHITKITDNTDDITLIYPKDKHVILNAIKVADEKGTYCIRYFVFMPAIGHVYEWTLVKPDAINSGDFSEDHTIKTISAFTKWNFSYRTLDDNTFWNDRVLAKDQDGSYKYLKPLK